MNNFFLKNIIPSPSNHQQQEQQQSDYQRLLQLCNSYGLNEEQTKQLIDQFRKGNGKGKAMDSVDQSMISEGGQAHDMSIGENEDQGNSGYNNSEGNRRKCQFIVQKKQSKNNFFHQQQSLHQQQYSHNQESVQLQPNYYQYHQRNEHFKRNKLQPQQRHDSYNQMTFNNQQQQNTQYHQQQDNIEFHQQLQNSQYNYQQQQQNSQTMIVNGFYQRNNLQSKIQNNNINHTQQNLNKSTTKNNNNKDTITYLKQPSQNSLPRHHQLSKNSITSQHSQQNLNPLYVTELIKNFQLLEKQLQQEKFNHQQTLKNYESITQINIRLQAQSQQIQQQTHTLKTQYENLKQQTHILKTNNTQQQSQIQQLSTLLSAEQSKTQILTSIQQQDSQLIQTLQNSLQNLTQLLKQKEIQNHHLQNKIFTLYDKIETQFFTQTSKTDKNLTKIDSTQSFTPNEQKKIQQENKPQQREKQHLSRQRPSNYGRRQLAQMIMNNMPSCQQLAPSQSSKQLARDSSTAKLTSSSSASGPSYTEQIQKQKSSLPANTKPPGTLTQQKQNIFIPLQVESMKRNIASSSQSVRQEDSKRRGSSRVDIKKYKGMIEQLRNSYGNVGGMR